MFWRDEDLARRLEGSHVLRQVRERREDLRLDYDEMRALAPDAMGAYSLDDWLWARTVVASRNFGIRVGDEGRTDALVPLADMLNHLRPRETKCARRPLLETARSSTNRAALEA